jgi:hypothetical protein
VNPSTGGYPPAFYVTMRAFVGPDVNRSVLLMRMFNSALAGFLLFAALALSRPVFRRATAVAWSVTLIPTGIFFIASVNPSSWAIIGAGFFWVFLLAFIRTPQWKSWRGILALLGAVITASMAVLSRSDTAAVLLVSVAAVLILEWKAIRKRFNPLWLLLAAVPLVAIALVFRVGRYLSELQLSFPAGNAATDQPNPILKTLLELPAFMFGIIGGQQPSWMQRESVADTSLAGYTLNGFSYGVGALDTWNPSIAGVLAISACVGAVFLGLTFHNKRKLAALAVVLAGFVAQVIVMRALASFGAWDNKLGIQWVLQPRYFFPYAILFVGLAALCYRPNLRLFNRVQATAIAIAMSVAGLAAIMATVARYMHGQSHSWVQFELFDAWWWSWGPSPVPLILAAFVATLVYMFAMTWLNVRSGKDAKASL